MSENIDDRLLPCPFCGSTNLRTFDNTVACKECDACGPDLGHCTGAACRKEATEAWNRRAAPAPAGVKVKALKWRNISLGGEDWEAATPFGKYVISVDNPFAGGKKWLWVPGDDEEPGSAHQSMTFAKAAAQADYDRRILSAIEPN